MKSSIGIAESVSYFAVPREPSSSAAAGPDPGLRWATGREMAVETRDSRHRRRRRRRKRVYLNRNESPFGVAAVVMRAWERQRTADRTKYGLNRYPDFLQTDMV